MYQYDNIDRTLVGERIAQFRDQVARRLDGRLTEEQFRPLRLMNGLYLQLHAYMLRIAIPYGVLSARQLRALAAIARRYDRGYGHFTTRQNLQLNWIKLDEAPDALAALAEVDMHAIQTSGNCIRNVTTDQYAGVAADEIQDPRIWCEAIRQWSTLHPEFSFLPRKFKIAMTGSPNDRAAVKVHDIGLRLHRDEAGEAGFEVIVGGGLGRTPVIGTVIRPHLPTRHLLSYLDAILRIYNAHGRRDNIYKARIKILVNHLGPAKFAEEVEAEWRTIKDGPLADADALVAELSERFPAPAYGEATDDPLELARALVNPDFATWHRTNVVRHRRAGYAIVNLSLKPPGGVPGDASSDQMDAVADLAERYSLSEIRVTHAQNLVLPHVRQRDLPELWAKLGEVGFATANIGLAGDIIACPGLDYCGLANARSIPIAQQISERFGDLRRAHDIGELQIKISGCINACGHHHVGHIGLLGVEKNGEEFYQITLGGSAGSDAALGEILGPAVSYARVADAIENLVETYLVHRRHGEAFLETVRRIGPIPFKERLYATA